MIRVGHVGPSAPTGVIRVVPEGYGAHVAAMSSAVIRPARSGNALGAIYAGALGATEVFKHTASVLSTQRVLHRHRRFCPVTLGPDLGRALDLPSSVTLMLSLIGVGAIGTGITLILSELPADGALLAVDRQRFGPENLGTYSIGTAVNVAAQIYKVELATRVLHHFDVREFPTLCPSCSSRSMQGRCHGVRWCSPRWTLRKHGVKHSGCGPTISSMRRPATRWQASTIAGSASIRA